MSFNKKFFIKNYTIEKNRNKASYYNNKFFLFYMQLIFEKDFREKSMCIESSIKTRLFTFKVILNFFKKVKIKIKSRVVFC